MSRRTDRDAPTAIVALRFSQYRPINAPGFRACVNTARGTAWISAASPTRPSFTRKPAQTKEHQAENEELVRSDGNAVKTDRTQHVVRETPLWLQERPQKSLEPSVSPECAPVWRPSVTAAKLSRWAGLKPGLGAPGHVRLTVTSFQS
ncbi:hypothetical protein AOLI_G00299690 [Acnodon oligacanthus]